MRNGLCGLASVLFLIVPAGVRADEKTREFPGQPVRTNVTRDTWVSNAGQEAVCNLGGASRLKLKSNQEMTLLDINPAALKGFVINGAILHLRSTGKPALARVTVSSLGAEWVEGTSDRYQVQEGSSSFQARQHPKVPWTIPGSDLCSVIIGQGGTTWGMADASPPDEKGWQRVAVAPAVVGARVAGLSYGFLAFDDTGSEWIRQGEKFTPSPFPNRFVFSREAGAASAPYLTVYLGDKDNQPPAAPTTLRGDASDLPPGETWLSWATPADAGSAGTLGFFVSVDGHEVPRYLIPLASKPGETVRMRLRDSNLKSGARVEVKVRAVDAAGNVGEAATAVVTVSSHTAPELPGKPGQPFTKTAPLPRLGTAEVAVLDELDKVHPTSGALVPPQADGYLSANHLWCAADHLVQLHAARNEFVAFQVLFRGKVEAVRFEAAFATAPKVQVAFGRYALVPAGQTALPDPIVSLTGPFSVPDQSEKVEGQQNGSLHVEVYVPHDTPTGTHQGKLVFRAGSETLTITLKLQVWDFTLPDYLSFIPDMNCYSLPSDERSYYRLAHRHRTVLNSVPYSQSGAVRSGWAPKWDGKQLDWSAWDRRFGPYFDGTAFADLPRRGVPLECFYLPLHENWPSPMEGNYNGSYWADRAFPGTYRQDFVRLSRLMAEHCDRQGWHETLFQCFLNNKVNYKQRGWSRGSSPWLLDEPAHFQDYWALRYYGVAFHEGVRQAGGRARMVFRADISRPMWQRDAFDGLLDYNVVGGALRRYHRMVIDRKETNQEIVIEYGSSNALAASNVQPVGWSLDAWTLGGDGVLPWQTVGTAQSWKQADTLSLFYPARGPGDAGPIPSVRLKAFRRGQQDVEYLTILQQVLRQPRWAVSQRVRSSLRLAGVRTGTGFTGDEDAGVIAYAQLLPQDVWKLRVLVGSALSEARPEPKRRWLDLRTPPRDPARQPSRLVSAGK